MAALTVVDASAFVARALAPYGRAIGTILGEVSGDPAAVRRAESTYRGGADVSGQMSTNFTTTSTRLSRSWLGAASNSFAGASNGLTERLDHARATLVRQADGMAVVAQAQTQTWQGVQRVARGFDDAARSLLAISRSVQPAAVEPLVSYAARVGTTCYNAAAAHKESLRTAYAAVARELNQATAAPRAKKTTADDKTILSRLYGCIRDRELSPGGPLRESEKQTLAGVRASLATPNQTTMENAIRTLKRHPELWGKVTPPLTKEELDAAEQRVRKVVELRDLAETRGDAVAEQAARNARATVARQIAAQTHLTELEATEARLRQQLNQAAPNDAKRAANELSRVGREIAKARKQRAELDARSSELIHAFESARDPAAFIGHNAGPIAATGLDRDDVRNMMLAGLMLREKTLSKDELAQVAALEQSLGGANRVTARAPDGHRITTEEFATRRKLRYEDLAGWQRKSVDNLYVNQKASVGARINEIAIYGEENRLLTDAFLQSALADARRRHPNNELAIVQAIAREQNASPAYIKAIVNCYNRKAAGKK